MFWSHLIELKCSCVPLEFLWRISHHQTPPTVLMIDVCIHRTYETDSSFSNAVQIFATWSKSLWLCLQIANGGGGRRGECKSGTKFIDCLRDDDDGPEAYSHHDKFPPWWESVITDLIVLCTLWLFASVLLKLLTAKDMTFCIENVCASFSFKKKPNYFFALVTAPYIYFLFYVFPNTSLDHQPGQMTWQLIASVHHFFHCEPADVSSGWQPHQMI